MKRAPGNMRWDMKPRTMELFAAAVVETGEGITGTGPDRKRNRR